MDDVNTELLDMKQAASRLYVSPQTIRNWYRAGQIKLIALPSGKYRVPKSEVDRILTEGAINTK